MKTKVNKKKDDEKAHVYNRRVQDFMSHYDLTSQESEVAIALLDGHLPHGYSEEIVTLAMQNDLRVTKQVVRLVKLGKTKNPVLFKLLLEFASQNKAREEDVTGQIKAHLSNDH